MTVTYKNRLTDLWRFSIYTYPRRRAFLILNGLMILVFSFLLWPSIARAGDGLLLDSLVFATILLLVLAFINFGTILLTLVSYVPKRNRAILTTHMLTLDDSGVTEETPMNLTHTKWSGVLEVRQNRSFIFLYVSEYGAHVIPKRALPLPADAERLFQFAKERQHASATV